MTTVVTSDLHLGSRYLEPAFFMEFLDGLPADAELVLNGDIVNRHVKKLPGEHVRLLDRIRSLSLERPVHWLRGNHDENFATQDPAGIRFADIFKIEHRFIVQHGHDFRNKAPRNPVLILLLRMINAVRRHFPAEPLAIPRLIKKMSLPHRIICRHVMANAVQTARENDVPVALCGHTHLAADTVFEGVRYINTGSWLAEKACWLVARNGFMDVREMNLPV